MTLLISNMSDILELWRLIYETFFWKKFNESTEPNNTVYFNKGNGDIGKLCISIVIYFMEFKNQTENKEEFLNLKNFKVHKNQYTEVLAQLVTINGKI